MPIPLRVLLVEDTEDDALLILRELRAAGYEPSHLRVDTPQAMEAALTERPWDLVLGDYNMPHFSGTAALALLQRYGVDAPFIFVSGTIGEDVAVAAMKAGAQDYVMKGNLKRLAPAIERELRDAETRRERRRAQEALLERARLAELNSDVGVAVSQSDSVQALLDRGAIAIVRHLDAALARLWTVNESAGRLELRARAGEGPARPDEAKEAALATSPLGAIARSQRPYVSARAARDKRVPEQEWVTGQGIVAFAGHPLLVQGRLVGMIEVYARHPLTDFAVKALGAMADAFAVGIERKQAEEALRATQARLHHVLSSSAAVLYTARIHPDVIIADWVSENITRILGYQPGEALASTWWSDNLHPDDRARVLAELPGLLEKGYLSVEYRLRSKNGTLLRIRDESRLLAEERPGAGPGIVGLWVDVSEGRKLEEQLRQSQKMEAVGRLAGGVAHDFNNLLTVITGYCDLALEDSGVGEALRGDLQEIRKAAEGATGLTRQLLAFSRQQVLQAKVLDLNSVVSHIEKLLRRLIGEHIKLVTLLAPELDTIKADPGQLEQVIMNLAVNARDAMPTGGTLTIETANVELDAMSLPDDPLVTPGAYVMLAVSDTGTGMDEATQARIFEPFFTTKEVGKGTGLGLATVYGIVRQSAGFLWVYSEPGHGATFKSYFPRADAPRDVKPGVVAPVDSLRGTETVLVVEDSAAVRAVTRRVLERHGYSVLEASDGQGGLSVAASHDGPIHLLVTDLVMPGLGGRDLALRLETLRPELVVLYMSGYTDDAVVRHGVLEAGIAYLQKPYTTDGLARKVREVLDARRPA